MRKSQIGILAGSALCLAMFTAVASTPEKAFGTYQPGTISKAVTGHSGYSAIENFGDATSLGSPSGSQLGGPIVGVSATPDHKGYWLVTADGEVFAYGDAISFGSASKIGPTSSVSAIASTPDGNGYWVVTPQGLVSDYGDATFQGDAGAFINAPVVGIASTPDGKGYWLVASDGGVFAFGDARFYGSMGGQFLNKPIVGIAPTIDGNGYWIVASDGGIFAFGDATFYGSMGGIPLNQPISGIAATQDGKGYWMVASDGGIFAFGDATFHGSDATATVADPVVAIAATNTGAGYWVVPTIFPIPSPTAYPKVIGDCDMANPQAQVEPSEIVLACGDGNAYLSNLSWSSWDTSGAVGYGSFMLNNCQPTCAGGTFIQRSAMVSLAYPVLTSSGYEFSTITYTYADPSQPGGTGSYTSVITTGGT